MKRQLKTFTHKRITDKLQVVTYGIIKNKQYNRIKYSVKTIMLLFVVLSSCKQDPYSTFTIQNSSNHDIHFAISQQGGYYSSLIRKDSSYMWTVPEGDESVSWIVSNADSVRIYFDYHVKVLTYYNYWFDTDSSYYKKRNPINIDFYTEECTREDGCDYTYVVTEEDYENSEGFHW